MRGLGCVTRALVVLATEPSPSISQHICIMRPGLFKLFQGIDLLGLLKDGVPDVHVLILLRQFDARVGCGSVDRFTKDGQGKTMAFLCTMTLSMTMRGLKMGKICTVT